MSIEGIKFALGSLEDVFGKNKVDVGAITTLRQAIEQAEKQKPVAWMYVNFDDECEQIEYGEPFDDPSVTPLYAAPPARQWVGLTKEEAADCWSSEAVRTWHAIEGKLKEKNNG
jgi:hypothetical protein